MQTYLCILWSQNDSFSEKFAYVLNDDPKGEYVFQDNLYGLISKLKFIFSLFFAVSQKVFYDGL